MDISINETVKKFISHTFLVDFDNDVSEDCDLFRSGFIDSFGFIELVNFLEKTFQIKITDEDLVLDSLTSIVKIVDCIQGKLYETTPTS